MDYVWKDKKILIVDDVEINRELLRYILEVTESELYFAKSIEEFYNNIKNNTFDLILLDINLGDANTDGIDLMNYLIKNNIMTPVILQTAYDVNDIIDYDVKYVIRKPIRKTRLFEMIDKIFKN